jgi:acyl carrier protein
VRAVIAATFNLDEDDLPSPLTQGGTPAWTSRSQVTLVLNLEKRFDVTFSLDQMMAMTSAQAIVEVLRQMTGPGSDP